MAFEILSDWRMERSGGADENDGNARWKVDGFAHPYDDDVAK